MLLPVCSEHAKVRHQFGTSSFQLIIAPAKKIRAKTAMHWRA